VSDAQAETFAGPAFVFAAVLILAETVLVVLLLAVVLDALTRIDDNRRALLVAALVHPVRLLDRAGGELVVDAAGCEILRCAVDERQGNACGCDLNNKFDVGRAGGDVKGQCDRPERGRDVLNWASVSAREGLCWRKTAISGRPAGWYGGCCQGPMRLRIDPPICP